MMLLRRRKHTKIKIIVDITREYRKPFSVEDCILIRTENHSRCHKSSICENYTKCLMEVGKRNWNGFICVEKSQLDFKFLELAIRMLKRKDRKKAQQEFPEYICN